MSTIDEGIQATLKSSAGVAADLESSRLRIREIHEHLRKTYLELCATLHGQAPAAPHSTQKTSAPGY